jgi:hypothetical protein
VNLRLFTVLLCVSFAFWQEHLAKNIWQEHNKQSTQRAMQPQQRRITAFWQEHLARTQKAEHTASIEAATPAHEIKQRPAA